MNWRWLRSFVWWWAVAIACLSTRGWWLLAAWPVLGVAQHAIGLRGHDALHFQVHPRRRVNEVFAAACLWPLGFFVKRWRSWHMRHHAMLGEPGRDPEVRLKLQHEERWTRRGQWMRDVVGLSADEMPRFWLDVNSGRARSAVGLPLAFGAGVLLAGGWLPLALWLVTLMTTQTAVFRIRAKLEHDIDELGVTVEQDRVGPLARLFVMSGAAWRHADHHRSPAARL